MRIVLTRILGNDLPPRHAENQTYENLRFILEHEPKFPDCEKRWIINRIAHPLAEAKLSQLLNAYGVTEYCSLSANSATFRYQKNRAAKLAYLTNINHARNWAVWAGFDSGAEFVLPFDGCCFLSKEMFAAIEATLSQNPDDAYFTVPMWRAEKYADVLEEGVPKLCTKEEFVRDNGSKVVAATEPQIIFGQKYDQAFNEELVYGQADKAELLWRIGVPGIWDTWSPELQKKLTEARISVYAGTVKTAGAVARLPSGNPAADSNSYVRGRDRAIGLNSLLETAQFTMRGH